MSIFKSKTVEPAHSEPSNAFWMKYVLSEMGQREVPGAGNNSRILEYHMQTSLKASEDSVSWCAAFANWVMWKAEIPGTNSALALSWLKWGRSIPRPIYGCIVIFDHGAGHGHVTFFDHEKDGLIGAIGGNQQDSVKLSFYPRTELAGFRWPY